MVKNRTKKKQGSKAAYVYMMIVTVFYALLLIAILALFIIFNGTLPNIGLQGKAYLNTIESILVIVWVSVITYLIYKSGKWMRDSKTLKRGIIAAFITTIISFFSPFPFIGGIIGLVHFLSERNEVKK